MVLMFQASDVIDKFISGQFFQNLRSFSCIQFNSFKFFLLFLQSFLQSCIFINQLKHPLLILLFSQFIFLFIFIELVKKLFNFSVELIDEGSSFCFFPGKFFEFLLVTVLIVVKTVLNGEDVFIDGHSVGKKLHKLNCTFSS